MVKLVDALASGASASDGVKVRVLSWARNEMKPTSIPEELKDVLESTEDTLSGAIRFVGTRVPVVALLDSVSAGQSLADFLEGFPNVRKEHAARVLNWERQQALQVLGLDRAS